MWFLTWLGITSVGIFLHPDVHLHGTHRQLGLPACPSVMIFHRPCPGCGLTTSFTAMVHFDFATALRAHLMGPLLYGLFTVSAIICGWCWYRKIKFDTDTKPFNWALGIFVGVFLLYGVVRFMTTSGYS